jgi:hypothetical protein
VENNIPVVTPSARPLSLFSGGFGGAAPQMKDTSYIPAFETSAAPPPAPMAHMNKMFQGKFTEKRIYRKIANLTD